MQPVQKKISPKELRARWKVKKGQVETLANNIQSLRVNLTKDLKDENEKVFLTALVLCLMDKTAERVGNNESANNGHFGITGLKKKHVSIDGDKIKLQYVGKSGVEHDKEFTDAKLADCLKTAIKRSATDDVFVTSEGFKVNGAKVNRYLRDFDISAKDIRGYSANKWVIEKLRAKDIAPEEKDRKKEFSAVLKSVAKKIGHGKATLRNQYLIPGLEKNYIEMGKIIDVSDKKERGGAVETNEVPIIVGNPQEPVKLEGGQVIINKKATKKHLDKLVEINNESSDVEGGKVTTDGTDGGLLKGKPHYDEKGNPTGGIPAVVGAGGKPIEVEGDEFVVSKEASKEHWKELSKINQSAGDGVPIGPPEADVDEYKTGGNTIEFNPNDLPSKWIYSYAKKIKTNHPEIWSLGGNEFGNEAFINLERALKRGYWLDSEEWMYVKWRAYVARHKGDYQIAGVIAMLKWVDKVEKGWPYMKNLIEEEVKKLSTDKASKGAEVKSDSKKLTEEEFGEWLKSRTNKAFSEKRVWDIYERGNNRYFNFKGANYGYDYSGKINQIQALHLKDSEKVGQLSTDKKVLGGGVDEFIPKQKYFVIHKEFRALPPRQARYVGLYGQGKGKYHKFTDITKGTSFNIYEGHLEDYEITRMLKDGGELEKGIEVEQEHKKTISDLYKHKITPQQAPERIAKDHLKEDTHYYTKLEGVEQHATGGGVEALAFILKSEGDKNDFYIIYTVDDTGKNYVDITSYDKLWQSIDWCKRYGYKVVSLRKFNEHYNIPLENRWNFKSSGGSSKMETGGVVDASDFNEEDRSWWSDRYKEAMGVRPRGLSDAQLIDWANSNYKKIGNELVYIGQYANDEDIYYGVVDANNNLVFESKDKRTAEQASWAHKGSIVKKYSKKMAKGGGAKDEVYVEFLNKDKRFTKDIKHFKSYEDAVKWCKANFERFDPDMIKYKSYAEGGPVKESPLAITSWFKKFKKEKKVSDDILYPWLLQRLDINLLHWSGFRDKEEYEELMGETYDPMTLIKDNRKDLETIYLIRTTPGYPVPLGFAKGGRAEKSFILKDDERLGFSVHGLVPTANPIVMYHQLFDVVPTMDKAFKAVDNMFQVNPKLGRAEIQGKGTKKLYYIITMNDDGTLNIESSQDKELVSMQVSNTAIINEGFSERVNIFNKPEEKEIIPEVDLTIGDIVLIDKTKENGFRGYVKIVDKQNDIYSGVALSHADNPMRQEYQVKNATQRFGKHNLTQRASIHDEETLKNYKIRLKNQ